MIGKLLLAALLAAQTALTGTDAPAPEQTTVLQWKMSLDARGQITALVPRNASKSALAEQLEPAVRGWNFEPAILNGEKAATETLLSVQIALIPSADGQSYSVRVDDVRTGGAIVPTHDAIRLPESEMRALKSDGGFSKLAFEVSYDASGSATEVTLLPDPKNAKGRLVEIAGEAVREWLYEPERVAGVGIPGKVIVPICYSAGKTKKRKGTRDGKRCIWSQPGSKAQVGNGDSLSVDSKVHLKTDVVGRAL